MKGQDFDVAEVRPVGPHVVAREFEAVEPAVVGRGAGGDLFGDMIVALFGKPRPPPALIVDEELGEGPLAALHVGQYEACQRPRASTFQPAMGRPPLRIGRSWP